MIPPATPHPKTYSAPRGHKGFTLIELLVVMAILVLLSVVGYRAMVTALDTRATVTHYNQRLRELQLGLTIFSRDLQQIQRAPLPAGQRPLTSNFGPQEKSVGELLYLFRSADAEMLRGVNGVRYTLENGQLIQSVESDNQRFQTPIMSGIDGVRVNFYDELGREFVTWNQPTLPQAVKITLRHRRYGIIEITEGFN